MSRSIRILTKDDWLSMQRLRMSRPTHAGSPVSSFTSNPISLISLHYQNAPHLAVGMYVDLKLDSFICAYQAENFWVLDLMVSMGNPQNLRDCLEYCLQHFEARGIIQFYYAFPQKWARSYRSFWKEGSSRLKRYTIEDLTVIEAQKKPSNEWLWEHIMHHVIIPVKLLVRRSYINQGSIMKTLKEHYTEVVAENTSPDASQNKALAIRRKVKELGVTEEEAHNLFVDCYYLLNESWEDDSQMIDPDQVV